jgi:phytoene dehydrogenase-like protein
MSGPETLDRECALLCRGIFGVEPPPGCAEAYRGAHAVVFAEAPIEAQAAARIAEAVRRGWDLEALELALRLRDKDNALTKKLNILFYLMEARPEAFAAFVNLRPSPVRAWLRLSGETLRSVYKLFKGWILLRRLGASHG